MVIVFDLDDTLYNEMDFVKSGFQEISEYLDNGSYYDFMLNDFIKNGSGKVFNNLIKRYNIDVSLQKLIEIYRFHIPNISLSLESKELLQFSQNYKTALISDGHYLMQKNKYRALQLNDYIKYPILTDFYHTRKPKLKPFEMVMKRYKNENLFIYISDNPKKDFIAPNKLGWLSIRYKNPVGIYKKYKSNASYEALSKKDIIRILKDVKIEK